MKKVLAVAWPIMLSYIPLGLACGVLASKCGINPLMGFLMSVTLITGSGQFMISNLWLVGLPAFSIVASVAAVSLRFALYSASLSPYLKKASKRMSLALSYTLIEEAYVVNEVTTLITPGRTVDVVVTEYGIAVNPARPEIAERLKAAGLKLVTLEELRDRALSVIGNPAPLPFGDKVVGVVMNRDGSVMDVIKNIVE